MEFTLKVTLEEINALLKALAKRPFEEVVELIDKIKGQAEQQLAAKKEDEGRQIAAIPEPLAEGED